MKDLAEEIVVMGDRLELPQSVSRNKAEIPAEEMILTIFTDVFDCVFRFLGAILAEDGTLREDEFWGTAAAVLREYQQRHPELADQFPMHDLFAPDFELSRLNRLHLRTISRCWTSQTPPPVSGWRDVWPTRWLADTRILFRCQQNREAQVYRSHSRLRAGGLEFPPVVVRKPPDPLVDAKYFMGCQTPQVTQLTDKTTEQFAVQFLLASILSSEWISSTIYLFGGR